MPGEEIPPQKCTPPAGIWGSSLSSLVKECISIAKSWGPQKFAEKQPLYGREGGQIKVLKGSNRLASCSSSRKVLQGPRSVVVDAAQ
jgi:hypothetical protein